MAMNKKEQAEFEAAKKAVVVARALNWSEPVDPDVPPPSSGTVKGFVFNAFAQRPDVSYALTSSTGHATSWDDFPERTTTQGARHLYSTKLRSLKALRHALEMRYAESLASIDMQIQKEQQP